MTQRPTLSLDAAIAGLRGVIVTLTRRLIPTGTAGRQAGGPVVFRHYL